MNDKNKHMEKWKPGVSKEVLLFLAGILWLMVGIMLDGRAYSWLRIESQGPALAALAAGFAASMVIHHFGFLRIVDRNLGRILPMEGKRCVFSFMPLKSYVLIMIMVAMGLALRHSAFPKLYLSVLYIGIGTALILSSTRYIRYLIQSRHTG